MNYLSKNLKYLRDAMQVKQSVVALSVGVCKSSVGHWETGYIFPSVVKLKALSNFYGVSIDWLIKKDLWFTPNYKIKRNYISIQRKLKN